MNQHNVSFWITAIVDISAILVNAFFILDPTNDPDLKKSRRIIGTTLIIIAAILTPCVFLARPSSNNNPDEPIPIPDEPVTPEPIPDNGTFIDDDNYLHYNGHTYVAEKHWDINTFFEAERYCNDFGAHLAIIEDDFENLTLYNYVFKHLRFNSAYFGLTDEGHDGYWEWVDGSPITYSNWMDGQPDDLEGEHYALFYYKDEPATWNNGDFGMDPEDGVIILIEWDENLE